MTIEVLMIGADGEQSLQTMEVADNWFTAPEIPAAEN
jgi:hypothetical protein